ncbi:MAG: helix-turn-helix domain-containing protein [Ilumatobacteraceae bacterium]
MARAGRRRGTEHGPRPGATEEGSARQVLIDATVATLAERGFSATSARAVAERAGVAAGGVFYHFGSMDDLLAAAFDQCNAERFRRLGSAVTAPREELPDALTAAARREFSSPTSRALLEIVIGSIGSPTLAAHVRRGVDDSARFTADVVRAVVGTSPAASVLPIDLVAELAASTFFGLEVLAHVGHEVDLEGVATLIRMLTTLLGMAPGDPTPEPLTRRRR